MKRYENMTQHEFECRCGYVWIDNLNYGCPLCGAKEHIVRREYNIPQPCSFGKRKKD